MNPMTSSTNISMNDNGKLKTDADKKTTVSKTLMQSPELTNALVIDSFKKNLANDHLELVDIVSSLQLNSEALQGEAPLSLAENLLMSQAQSLNSIFCDLAVKASSQSNVDVMEKLLRLSLKAQSQCRATLETLANMKNPPVVFAKQANIAHNQQVNNHPTSTQISKPSAQSQAVLERQPMQAIPTVTKEKVAVKRSETI